MSVNPNDVSPSSEGESNTASKTRPYMAALQGSGQVFFLWNTTSGSIEYKGDLFELTGYRAAELSGGLTELTSRVHLEDLSRLGDELQRALAERDYLKAEFRFRRSEGQYIPIIAQGAFFAEEGDAADRCAGFLTNATRLHQAEEQLAAAHRKLHLYQDPGTQATDSSIPVELHSRISHELRTPLNAILGFTQLLEMEPSTPSQLESLQHITRAGRHLLGLINKVLDVPDELPPKPDIPYTARVEENPLRIAKVLYVEDENADREYIQRIFETLPDYQLTTVGTGAEALECLRSERPDLVLLDLYLPDISGEAVLASIKENPEWRHIPVVLVTAEVMGKNVERLLCAGALTYVIKPFRVSELVALVRSSVGR